MQTLLIYIIKFPPLLQKSMNPTLFWRLREAQEFVASCPSEGLKIFAFQVERTGGRRFKVMNLQEFWDIYQNLEPKYYYEVVPPSVCCKLFFDLEFEASTNPERDGLQMISKIIDLVNEKLFNEFKHKSTISDVLVLQSFHKTKFSSHLVFPQTIFKNIIEVGGFIKNFTTQLSQEDKQFLTINHNGQEQLLIDMSVYKKNQQFRIMGSRKMGRMNPLIVSSVSTSELQEFNKDSVMSSLLTNIDDSIEVLKSDYNSTAIFVGQRENQSIGDSPFKEVDDCIKKLIAPGRISSWTYHSPSETYCFSIEGHSFCRNVGRPHSNSKIFFLFCVRNRSLWQQCFSSHCKGFKSNIIDLPDLSWMDFDLEPWDE